MKSHPKRNNTQHICPSCGTSLPFVRSKTTNGRSTARCECGAEFLKINQRVDVEKLAAVPDLA